jgi:hypothetical protein
MPAELDRLQHACRGSESDDLDHSVNGTEPNVLLQDRLTKAKERLEDALDRRRYSPNRSHLQ